MVRLNRRKGTLSASTGLYCCEVLDATLQIRKVCANISKLATTCCFITMVMMPTFYAATLGPENFTAIPTNSREIQFSWSSLADINADSSSMILNYTLTCRPNVPGVTSVMMTYNEAGIYTLGGFRPATEYNCSVFASSSIDSGPSASINVTSLDECKSDNLIKRNKLTCVLIILFSFLFSTSTNRSELYLSSVDSKYDHKNILMIV